TDFAVGIFLRNGSPINNTPVAISGFGTNAICIATDNTNSYVAGTLYDGANVATNVYVQKFDLAANALWSAKIVGFDSTSNNFGPTKIVYDRASGAVYVAGTAYAVGSTVIKSFISKI